MQPPNHLLTRYLEYVLVALIFVVGCHPVQQDQAQQINGVRLGMPLSESIHQFYFYDGSEPFYKDYPTIRESLLNNLESGIKQGIYEGEPWLHWDQYKARQMRVTFFEDRLYQVQWDFAAYEDTDIELLAGYLNERFTGVFGAGKVMEYPDFTLHIWQDSSYYLSIFQESDLELTIEFRGLQSIEELKRK